MNGAQVFVKYLLKGDMEKRVCRVDELGCYYPSHFSVYFRVSVDDATEKKEKGFPCGRNERVAVRERWYIKTHVHREEI